MDVTPATIFARLFAHYGAQGWWPGETPLEVMVGAVLTQNTNWKNVERAINNLREADLLDLRTLYELDIEELAELIRPAGYYRLKAGRLHRLLEFVVEHYDGSLEAMFATNLEDLRAALLGVNGIGPETADSILLYAGGLPSFVVDAYTHRIMKRHGWVEFEADYHQLKDYFESGLDRDATIFNEFHALFVQVGKDFCRKVPRCDGCPLREWLPEQGPLDPEW